MLMALGAHAQAEGRFQTLVAQADATLAPEPAAPVAPKWSAQCASVTRNAPPECSIQQNAALNGRPFASATVRLPAGQPAILVLRVPSEIDLHAGLTFQIDDAAPRTTGIETCDGTACYSRTLLDDATREAMRAGKNLSVTFRGFAAQRDVSIPFDLDGFAAGFDAIQ